MHLLSLCSENTSKKNTDWGKKKKEILPDFIQLDCLDNLVNQLFKTIPCFRKHSKSFVLNVLRVCMGIFKFFYNSVKDNKIQVWLLSMSDLQVISKLVNDYCKYSSPLTYIHWSKHFMSIFRGLGCINHKHPLNYMYFFLLILIKSLQMQNV